MDSIKAQKDYKVMQVDTQNEFACSELKQDNCRHCHATYGHKINCPNLVSEYETCDRCGFKVKRGYVCDCDPIYND